MFNRKQSNSKFNRSTNGLRTGVRLLLDFAVIAWMTVVFDEHDYATDE